MKNKKTKQEELDKEEFIKFMKADRVIKNWILAISLIIAFALGFFLRGLYRF